MTREQLQFATRLFELATMAHGDAGGAVDREQQSVMTLAAKNAKAALRALGVDPVTVLTIQDTIRVAKKRFPTTVTVTDTVAMNRARHLCPECERRGLGYARHPHAFGHYDHRRASCRFCGGLFPIRGR